MRNSRREVNKMERNTKIIAALIVIGMAAVFLNLPGVVSGIYYSITGIAPPCNTQPYATNCVCDQGERKIYVPWALIPKWHCEDIEKLLIDPDSPTFEDDSVAFVKNQLEYYCGNVCTDLDCGTHCGGPHGTIPIDGSDRCMESGWGYGANGERTVDIQCRIYEGVGGYSPWRMWFFVESETDVPNAHVTWDNYCKSPDLTQRCEIPVNVAPFSWIIFPS
jgi:hypothetical protein